MPFDSKDFVEVKHADEIAILDKMAELLATPERWHQGDFQNECGTAFCLVGAYLKASGYRVSSNFNMYKPVFQALIKEAAPIAVPLFNDNPRTSHKDVLDLIARARASFL